MKTITVPFHLDEPLPRLRWPVDPGRVVAPELPEGTTWERLAALYEPVADEVAEATRGEPVLVLSGDCTTSLATVAGLQRAAHDPGRLGIVWFDAHGDLQHPATTTSGYLGGMALRMLLGEGDPTVADGLGLKPVDPGRTVLVDGRDLDPPEREFLAATPVRRQGVDELTAPSRELPSGGPLYVHLDLDVLDPDHLPGLLFPSPNGPDPTEVIAALRAVLATGEVAAVGLGCTWRQDEALVPAVQEIADFLVRELGGTG